MDLMNTLGPGAIPKFINGIFGGGRDPYKEASQFYNQIPGQTRPFYDPYMNAGKNAMGQLQGQYGQLIGDPGGMLSKIGGGYQQSPGYNFALQQALQAGTNASAAGGMAGSPQHSQNAMTTATGLANQDYNNYLKNALGLYGTGIQGLQGINQMGFGASDQMAKIMADMLSQQGNMAYGAANSANQNAGNMLGNIGSLAALAFL